MNFYHILFALKQGFNRNLTWYENLFVKFYNNTIAKLAAKILRIKGNTVSFNQLASSISGQGWTLNRCTKSSSGETTTFTSNSVSGQVTFGAFQPITTYKPIVGHKYYFKAKFRNDFEGSVKFNFDNINDYRNVNANTDYQWSNIQECTSSVPIVCYGRLASGSLSGNEHTIVSNAMLFDLTLMGIDNLTTTAEVEAYIISHLGNLEYFGFTLGTLIPFMGTGLKTVGKNIFDALGAIRKDGYVKNDSGTEVSNSGAGYTSNYIDVFPNSSYTLTGNITDGVTLARVYFYDGSKNWISRSDGYGSTPFTITTPTNCHYIQIQYKNGLFDPSTVQIELGSSATAYEPYTSNTLSLPTLTYFPTGIKVVPDYANGGDIADELTPSKAITRVGSYTFTGNESTGNPTSLGTYYRLRIIGIISNTTSNVNSLISNGVPRLYDFYSDTSHYYIQNGDFYYFTNKSTTSEILNELVGVTVFFENKTSIETSISPQLDLTYPIWNGGTEQILPVNTSIPTTSGIVADIKYPDGIRYDQAFVYRVIEKVQDRCNRALSIMLGKKVETDNPEEPLEILLKGEK